MASEDWYYASGPEHVGPFSREQITALVHSGVLRADTPVRRSEPGGWLNAGDIEANGLSAELSVTMSAESEVEPQLSEVAALTDSSSAGSTSADLASFSRQEASNPGGVSTLETLDVDPAEVARIVRRVGWGAASVVMVYLLVIAGDLLFSYGQRKIVRSLGDPIMFLSAAEYERHRSDRSRQFMDCQYGDCSGQDYSDEYRNRPYGYEMFETDIVTLTGLPHEKASGAELVWIRREDGREGVIPCKEVRTLWLGRDSC